MKRKTKISTIILLALMVVGLSSCDNVYYGAISGSIQNSSGEGISGVNVYAYTSKSERDRVFESYEKGDFNDPNCDFRATTLANGNFSIGKVVWKNSNSEWGKDYDSTSLYFVFFSKDYGIKKYDGVNIISGASNAASFTFDMGNPIRTISTLTLRFKDYSDLTSNASRKNVTDTISFTYSYNDGYTEVKENVSTINGEYKIPVKLLEADDKKETIVTISDIKQADGYWSVRNSETNKKDESANYSFIVDSSDETGEIKLRREKWNLSTGVSGTINTTVQAEEKGCFVLDGTRIEGEINGIKDVVFVTSTDTPAIESGKNIKGEFSGLFEENIFPVSYLKENSENEKPESISMNLSLYINDTLKKENLTYKMNIDNGKFDRVFFFVNEAEIDNKSLGVNE